MMAGLRLLPDGCQLRPLARCLRGGYAEGDAQSTEISTNILYFSRPEDVWPVTSLAVQLTTSHAHLGQKEGNGADPRRNFRSRRCLGGRDRLSAAPRRYCVRSGGARLQTRPALFGFQGVGNQRRGW